MPVFIGVIYTAQRGYNTSFITIFCNTQIVCVTCGNDKLTEVTPLGGYVVLY